jgi:hypothetical protein
MMGSHIDVSVEVRGEWVWFRTPPGEGKVRRKK